MAAFNFHRRKTRRWWYVGTTFVVAAFFAVFFVTSSAALNSSPSNFEAGDGNMTLGATGNTDWNCFQGTDSFATLTSGTPTGCAVTSGASNTSSPNPDFEQTPGEKFDTACPTFKTGNNPPKDVWSDVSQYLESAQNGDIFFYGASIRPVVNGNSSGNIYFSQGTNPNGANCRTKGDVLLTFDFTGGGTKPTLHVLTWQVGSGSCFVGSDSTTTGCWGPSNPPELTGSNANSDGETNATQINAADNGLNGQNVLANGFSEIGVNLTQAIKDAGGTATCFANETWVSRSSGSSFTSSPEMVVNESQPTCGTITIIKHTLDGAGNRTGIDQPFGYTTTGALTPSTFKLNDSGSAGSYSINSISATNPAVVTTTAANTITSGQVVTISGSNSTPLANGSWVATRLSSTTFSIPLAVTTAGTAAGTVSMSNTQTYSDVPAGSYTVTEGAEPANFAFVSLACTSSGSGTSATPDSTGSTTVMTATINLSISGNVVCTYTNQQQLGAILITKTGKYKGCSTQTAGSAIMVGTTPTQIGICGPSTALTTAKLGGATFSVTSSGTAITGSPFTTSNTTGAVCIGGLPFGSYVVTETGAPTGYKRDSSAGVTVSVSNAATCNSNNNAVATGTAASQTFTDTPLTNLSVTATAQRSGATNSTITCSTTDSTFANPFASNGPADPATITVNGTSGLPPGDYYCHINIDP